MQIRWIKSRTYGVQEIEIRSTSLFKRRHGPLYIHRGVFKNLTPTTEFQCSERYVFDTEEDARQAVIDRQLTPENEHQQP